MTDELIVACPNPTLRALYLAKRIYREGADGLEKRCPRCQEYWPADSEFFHLKRASADGLNCYCRACQLESSASSRKTENQPQPKGIK